MNLIDKIDKKVQKQNIKELYSDKFYTTLISEQEDSISWKNKIEEDVISHFFLCIAFCRNEMQKNW